MERVTLGGKEYELADLNAITFAQHQYLMPLAALIGVHHVWPDEKETDEQYLLRLQRTVAVSGKSTELLAGYLIPPGAHWTPELARKTCEHLNSLTDLEDQLQAQKLAAEVAPDFFARALASFGISLSYSSALQKTKDQADKHAAA